MNILARMLIVAAAAPLISASDERARELTFQERVRAQEAIERVHYSHQIGTIRPFEEAVPREALERKVRTYLKQSVALETFWKTSVTAGMLEREAERMARGSRMPERLRELYAALDDDPVLILECLARPALVDRLTRNFYAFDERIHAEARRQTDVLRRRLASGEVDLAAEDPSRMVVEAIRDPDAASPDASSGTTEPVGRRPADAVVLRLSPEQLDRWSETLPAVAGEIGAVVEERDAFQVRIVLEREPDRVRFLNYRVDKRPWDAWWATVDADLAQTDAASVVAAGGQAPRLDVPGADLRDDAFGPHLSLCVPDDTWAVDAMPVGRTGHTVVWTGSRMVVWGGSDGAALDTGGRYDPATDTWTPTSTTNAPSARYSHTAVWTGSLMIVWGGSGSLDTGGRYDPVTDTWSPTSTTNAPPGRSLHTAVWTGSLMVVWGGVGSGPDTVNTTGGRYDPDSDSWTATSTANAPFPRTEHTAVWTGTLMVVWGGSDGAELDTGGRYDPAGDTWTPTSTIDAPSPRTEHTAVWTGSLMVVWGGRVSGPYLGTGGRYDPAGDTWTPTSTTNAPSARAFHTIVWTGSRMVVWGGWDSSNSLRTGGRYDAVADTWTPTSTTNAPPARREHTAVWTGSLMIVWGGYAGGYVNTGGRYDPAGDSWTPTLSTNAPSARSTHTAVWTGSQMIVWGGVPDGSVGTGGRYDPATDTWTPTSILGAPSGRYHHTAVWTGNLMIVWGGGGYLNTGGRYDPITDNWTPTSTTNAPSARSYHVAVWTGNAMLVWGGVEGGGPHLDTGGRYDPAGDTWTQISTTNAPAERAGATAIWTGSLMIVWGASPFAGGLYDPVTNTWMPTSTTDAPYSGRALHTAIWTGSRMIVWGGVASGIYLNSGGLYDPSTDTWAPASGANAPSARSIHSAVWAGDRMIVWGGYDGTTYLRTGARYDPISDAWAPTSTASAPAARAYHTAVWMDGAMVVWGGYDGSRSFGTGGRYGAGASGDGDGDGFSACAGDCRDSDPNIHPGAPEICDGQDSDCDGTVPAGETDADGDGVRACGGDCDDGNGAVWATPGEALDLTLRADGVTLDWMPPAAAAGVTLTYDALRSASGWDFTGVATCVESDDGSDTMAIDGVGPPPSAVFYYLVRAENACPGSLAFGPLGTMSDGTPRTGRACP